MGVAQVILVVLFGLINYASCYEVIVKEFEPIAMGTVQQINLKVSLSYQEEDTWDKNHKVRLNFTLTDKSSWALQLLNESLTFAYNDMLWSQEKGLSIEAKVIGVDSMNITSVILNEANKVISHNDTATEVKLIAVLGDRTLNNLFTIIMMAMIIINTVNMGGQLDLQIIKEVFKKPIGPLVGFVSQFVLMPLVYLKYCH
jgi:hypothetical protein